MAQVTGTIKVVSDSMTGANSAINGHLQQIEQSVSGIKNTVAGLIGEGWVGGAALAAQELHATLHQKHAEINQAVTTFNQNINIANQNYTQMDLDNAKGFRV